MVNGKWAMAVVRLLPFSTLHSTFPRSMDADCVAEKVSGGKIIE
jgi:hypothetical protein